MRGEGPGREDLGPQLDPGGFPGVLGMLPEASWQGEALALVFPVRD